MNNSATYKSLIVLQFNANGLKNHVNELKNIYGRRIGIALITETCFTKYTHIFIPGYKLIKAYHPDNIVAGGIAILIKNSIHFLPLTNYCFDYIQSCTTIIKQNNITITVGAFYFFPRHNISTATFADFFNTIKNNCIIGGDLNVKHNSSATQTTLVEFSYIIFSTPTTSTYYPHRAIPIGHLRHKVT